MRELHSLTEPVAGFYRRRLVKGAVWTPVHIWYGPPADPVTGEPLDRSPRWQARQGDKVYSDAAEAGTIERIWVASCREPITKAEYDFLLADRAWARQYAPDTPEANPTTPVDLGQLPPLF